MEDFLEISTPTEGTFFITRHLIRLCQKIHKEPGGDKSYHFAEELQEPFHLSQILKIVLQNPLTRVTKSSYLDSPVTHYSSQWFKTIISIRSDFYDQTQNSHVMDIIVTQKHKEIIAIGCDSWLITVDANRLEMDKDFAAGTKFDNVDPGFCPL